MLSRPAPAEVNRSLCSPYESSPYTRRRFHSGVSALPFAADGPADLRLTGLRTTDLVVEAEAERQAWQSRSQVLLLVLLVLVALLLLLLLLLAVLLLELLLLLLSVISRDSLDGVRRGAGWARRSLMWRSPRTLPLPLPLPLLLLLPLLAAGEPLAGRCGFFVRGLRRGILLAGGLGNLCLCLCFCLGLGEGRDASEPGCDTQSSERELSQACPMVASGVAREPGTPGMPSLGT